MPDLKKSLSLHEPYILNAIAASWNLSASAESAEPIEEILARKIIQSIDSSSLRKDLPESVRPAIEKLVINNGKIQSGPFFRLFGEIEVMGEARFIREEPWKSPQNPVQWLWYRGLIQKSFFDTPEGMREYVYLPDELYDKFRQELKNLPIEESNSPDLIIRPAAPREVVQIYAGNDSVLDLSCLILASLRTGYEFSLFYPVYGEKKTRFTVNLLQIAGILDQSFMPIAETGQSFLMIDRLSALLQLIRAWQQTEEMDELLWIKELAVDELFAHNPSKLRTNVMQFLNRIHGNGWWSFSGFLSAVKQDSPDFLRNQNDSTAWLIRNREKNQYKEWENVEGIYLRYLLSGPLHWLGIVDIASNAPKSENPEKPDGFLPISAFRVSRIGERCLAESLGKKVPKDNYRKANLEKVPPKVTIDGRISVNPNVPRILRYHIARFCEWEKIQPDRWIFRVTPESLLHAKENGLSVPSFIAMLKRSGEKALPEALLNAVEQWDRMDTQATMFQATVLTVTNPDWIASLLNSKDTSQWIQQQLNANTVFIKPKGEEAVRRALIEMGVLTDTRK